MPARRPLVTPRPATHCGPRRLFCALAPTFTALLALLLAACSGPVDTVREAHIAPDESVSIEQALKRYPYFKKITWSTFTDSNGKCIVQAACDIDVAANCREVSQAGLKLAQRDVKRDYSQILDVRGFEALTGIPTAGPAAPRDALYYSVVPYDQNQYALFGEGTWSVNERLDITAGLRWSSYEETRTLTFDGIFAERTIDVPGDTDADDFAPRVIVAYKATDDITLNAQASKGFRLGGINDPLNRPLCTPADFATFNALSTPSFDNETVWNYEAGVKAEFADRRGSLTFAAFYSDIENLQATIDAGSCSSRVIVNVPKAKSAGVEAELSYSFNSNFDVAASASYNNAELTSSVEDAAGVPIQGLRDGNRLPTVPEFQAAFSLNYVGDQWGEWTPFGNLTWQYVGDRFTQVSDQEDNPRDVALFGIGAPTVSTLSFPLELPDYQIVNLRGGLRYRDFELALFVQNLTDERALLSIDRERGLRARYGYQTNQPRTIGVTFRQTF